MKKLLQSCDRDLVMLDVKASSLDVAVRGMVDELARKGVIRGQDVPAIIDELHRKEKMSASAIGHSLAIPHAYLDCIPQALQPLPWRFFVRNIHNIYPLFFV